MVVCDDSAQTRWPQAEDRGLSLAERLIAPASFSGARKPGWAHEWSGLSTGFRFLDSLL
jgi:hypothetical protein